MKRYFFFASKHGEVLERFRLGYSLFKAYLKNHPQADFVLYEYDPGDSDDLRELLRCAQNYSDFTEIGEHEYEALVKLNKLA